MSKPFARVLAFMAAMAKFGSGPAIDALGTYKSRGHGRGGHSGKKWGPVPSGKYVGVTNGKREVARRQRQMQKAAA